MYIETLNKTNHLNLYHKQHTNTLSYDLVIDYLFILVWLLGVQLAEVLWRPGINFLSGVKT